MSKEKVLVLFGDSLTDYFPMELFQDVEAQVYNRGEEAIQCRRWLPGQRWMWFR